MRTWSPDWIVDSMRRYSAANDIRNVVRIMSDSRYKTEMGLEAVGISMTRGHVQLAYEILTFKDTFNKYKEHASPFMVMDKLEQRLIEYVPVYRDQSLHH